MKKYFRIAFRVMLVGALITAITLYLQRHRVAAYLLDKTAATMMEQFYVPLDQREATLEVLRTVTDKVRKGEISADQAKQLAVNLQKEGRSVMILMEYAFVGKYLEPSGLDSTEKRKGKVTANRFIRVLINQKPTDAKAVEKIKDIVTLGGDKQGFKEKLSDAELREVIKNMKKAADKSGIGFSTKKWDLAGQLRKDIDKALKVK